MPRPPASRRAHCAQVVRRILGGTGERPVRVVAVAVAIQHSPSAPSLCLAGKARAVPIHVISSDDDDDDDDDDDGAFQQQPTQRKKTPKPGEP